MALTKVNSGGIEDGSIVNADIKSDAAIAKSKLAGLDIVNADINNSAAIATSKISGLATSATTDTTNASNIGSGTLPAARIGDDSIVEDKLDISNTASDGQFLQYKDSTDKLTWATVSASDATKMPLAGGTFTGDVTFDNQVNAGRDIAWDESDDALEFADNTKAVFGTSGDGLSIYHNGSNSYIDDSGTGNLYIRSNEVRINKYTGEYMIRAIADGSVSLYHDNTKKLETTTSGIKLESGSGSYTPLIEISNVSSGAYAGEIRFNSYYNSTAYNAASIQATGGSNENDGALHLKTRNSSRFKIDKDGYITKPNLPSFHCVGTPTISNNPGGGSGYDNVCHSFGTVQQVGSHYDNSNGRFTAPVAGMYHFTFGIWSGNADASNGNHNAQIRKNGSTNVCGCNHTRDYNNLNMSCTVYLAANDIITPYFNGTGRSSTPRNFFSGHLLG